MKFMIDEVALELSFNQFSLIFPLLIIIPPLLPTNVSPPRQVRESPDNAAHYHSLGLQVRDLPLTCTWLVAKWGRFFSCFSLGPSF
jgi:hypothetical protein